MTRAQDQERLRALGDGTSIAELCANEGWDRARFDSWWSEQLAAHQPAAPGRLLAGVETEVTILRDERGVPHVEADDERDLFIGYGYCMAMDRLFQLDIRRRKGLGRVAALLGPIGIEDDRAAHTMGLPDLAATELARLDPATRELLDHFAVGVELAVASLDGRLPIEYALLGATWEPWSTLDAIACATSWRWQFTGRPHVVAGPEVLRRTLGDDALVELVLAHEREADVSILPPDAAYPPAPEPDRRAGATADRPSTAPSRAGDSPGSNDWVMSGAWSRSGLPLVASDPHMPYESTSSFYEVGLHGGTFDAVGAGMIGMPGLIMGRNRRAAWAMTNNICSLRDLYAERPIEGRPDAVEWDGQAVAIERRTVSVEVRGQAPLAVEVARTPRGPIIDALLPGFARDTGPVSMRWLGAEPCTWPKATLDMTRAGSVEDSFAAMEGWLVPSFGMVVADVDGAIGFKASGRIPLRSRATRTYRHGWDPEDRWTGLIPDAAMPRALDPARGWLASANNRPAPDDYPYPLSGTWSEGYRVRRIGELIEALPPGSADRSTLAQMHLDVLDPRAAEVLDTVVELIGPGREARERRAVELLAGWDGRATADSAGAAIFEVFYHRWAQAVTAERVPDRELADALSGWLLGLATALLRGEATEWLPAGRREPLALATFAATLDELEAALGPDPGAWSWGALRPLWLPHPLSGRGDLGELLDIGVGPVGGSLATLSNSGFDMARPTGPGIEGSLGWRPANGAGYRLEVDLGEDPPAAWAITLESQSGVPGSEHERDQVDDFLAGRTRRLPLDLDQIRASARSTQQLVPGGVGTPGART